MPFPDAYAIALDLCPTPLMVIGEDGIILFGNHHAAGFLGYPDEGLEGMSVERFVPEPVRDGHADLHEAYNEVPGTRRMGTGRDLKCQLRDGTLVPVEVALEPTVIEGRRVVMVSVVDVSLRKSIEDRTRRVFDASPSAMLIVDATGRIQMANEQTTRMLGYTTQELIGTSIDALVAKEIRRRHAVYRAGYNTQLARRKMGAKRELFALSKDGRKVAVEINLTPVHSPVRS